MGKIAAMDTPLALTESLKLINLTSVFRKSKFWRFPPNLVG